MIPVGLPKNGFWIYLIINRVNNKVYVGKSRNPYARCHQYIYDFRERKIGHLNDHLFNALRKYGMENFVFRTWEACTDDAHATERELFWIDRFDTTNRVKGYNLRRDSRAGMITHPETSKKIRANLAKQYANGQRSDHGKKMVAKWVSDPERRKEQGKIFSQIKTRYTYVVSDGSGRQELLNFAQLRERALSSVLSSFHRTGTNFAILKGYRIERVPHAKI